MRKSSLALPVLAVLAIVTTLGISSWMSPAAIVPLQEATPTSFPFSMPPTEGSWVIVDLPEDATQLEYGAEIYRLVCKACHGDIGWGLTDEWRAQWAPKDQNCWQSKCHGDNHPTDGFYMPGVPAVVGEPIRKFGNAFVLYTYNRAAMPYHDRGNMTDYESWAVTAYILKINDIDPPLELNAENAVDIDLGVIDPNLGPTPTLPAPSSPNVQPSPTLENTPTLPALPSPNAQLSPTLENTPTLVPTPEQEIQTVADVDSLHWVYIPVLFIVVIGFIVVLVQRRDKE